MKQKEQKAQSKSQFDADENYRPYSPRVVIDHQAITSGKRNEKACTSQTKHSTPNFQLISKKGTKYFHLRLTIRRRRPQWRLGRTERAYALYLAHVPLFYLLERFIIYHGAHTRCVTNLGRKNGAMLMCTSFARDNLFFDRPTYFIINFVSECSFPVFV